jgi:SAM-dependent methyltransferase
MAGEPARRFCCDDELRRINYDGRCAAQNLAAYREHGPNPVSSELSGVLSEAGVEGARVLEIGAGIGVVHLALLEHGAASAVDVDASREYLDIARAEAQRRGLAGRVSYRYGDVVGLADELPPADVVVLDSVVCCYPYLPELLTAVVRSRPRLVGISLPHDAWWMRGYMHLYNLLSRLMRRPDRYWIHRRATVERLMAGAGYRRFHLGGIRIWKVLAYRTA